MRRSLTQRPLIFTARDCSRCPAFSEGQKVALMGRCVIHSATTANCAFLMANIKPLIESIESNINPEKFGINLTNGIFHCRDVGCFATFKVKALKNNELNSLYDSPSSNVIMFDAEKYKVWNLDKMPFIRKLDIEEAGKLIKKSTLVKYNAGSTLLKKGLRCSSLSIINKGEARVMLDDESSPKFGPPAAVLSSGEIFGEYSLAFSKPSPHTVIANTDITVWKISYENLNKCLFRNNELRKQFSEALAGRLSKQNLDIAAEISQGSVGQFSMLSIIDIIQYLSLLEISGNLSIKKDNIKYASLSFEKGLCIDAEYQGKIGLEALTKIVGINSGTFNFDKKTHKHRKSLDGDIIPLLISMSNNLSQKKYSEG